MVKNSELSSKYKEYNEKNIGYGDLLSAKDK